MRLRNDAAYASIRLFLVIYAGFVAICYIYVLVTGTYNGDFMNVKPKLSSGQLNMSLFQGILPFLIAFIIYKSNAKFAIRHRVSIPVKALGIFLFFLIIIQIFMTFVYGVGQMGRERNTLPLWIRIINLFINRFDVRLGVSLYILCSEKKDKVKYILILLILVLSIGRLSLSTFAYLPFLFILCHYHGNIIKIVKKWRVLIIVAVIVAPSLVISLYDLRWQLRGSDIRESERSTAVKVIFGRLVGRLSSYSNSSMIIERKTQIMPKVEDLSSWQFLKEALFIQQPEKQLRYSNVVLESFGNNTRLMSYMNGTPGTLYIGYYISPAACLINLSVMLILMSASISLARLFRCKKITGLVFLSICNSLVPGDAYSSAKNVVNLLAYLFLFLCVNFLIQSVSVRMEA
jgi:hypothetical protein